MSRYRILIQLALSPRISVLGTVPGAKGGSKRVKTGAKQNDELPKASKTSRGRSVHSLRLSCAPQEIEISRSIFVHFYTARAYKD